MVYKLRRTEACGVWTLSRRLPLKCKEPDEAVRVYRARWIVENARLLHEGAELVVHKGRVRGIRRATSGAASMDFGEAIILPGFVNAHTHLDLTLCNTAREYAQHTPQPDFWEWVRRVVAYRRAASREQLIASVREGVRRSLEAGVVAVGDITTLGLPLECWHPLRGVVFGEVLGVTPEREADALERAAAWLNTPCEGATVRRSVSPHAPYSTSLELYQRCADLVKPLGLPLATHLAETPEELAVCGPPMPGAATPNGNGRQQRPVGGPLVELLTELNAWRPDRMARVQDVVQLISHGTVSWIVAHGNFLSKQHWLALRNWATIVYCPSTHARFHRKEHPYELMSEDGVEVALGTDSLASARSLSPLDEARSLFRKGTRWSPAMLLKAVTRIPARGLGLHHHGALETGCAADFAVLRVDTMTDAPLEHVLGTDAPVIATAIGGTVVYQSDNGAS